MEYKKILIKTEKLDNVYTSKDINFGDVLKIDTQGTELKILKGASKVIKNTKFIIAEAAFVKLYDNQNLFSELEIFLRKRGFPFIVLQTYFIDQKNILIN